MRPAAVAAPIVATGAALVAWSGWIEPRRTVVRRRTLRLADWPGALEGLRIGLVSDLHASAPHVDAGRVERVAALVQRQRPDLICLLGDFVDWKVSFARPLAPEVVARALGALRAPLGVVAVLGNHDHKTDGPRVASALREAGIAVLENAAMPVGRGERTLWIAGLEDPTHRTPDVAAALERVPAGAPLVVLSHDPDMFPGIPARAALTLSGHTHGGQVNLPLVRRRILPSRYRAGAFEEGGRRMFVTRGIGEARLPVRVGAPPEVVVLTLVAS